MVPTGDQLVVVVIIACACGLAAAGRIIAGGFASAFGLAVVGSTLGIPHDCDVGVHVFKRVALRAPELNETPTTPGFNSLNKESAWKSNRWSYLAAPGLMF